MSNTEITRTVQSNRQVGGTIIQEEAVSSAQIVDKQEYGLLKTAKFLWYISHFIAIVLGLRFVFLLLGANLTGIVRIIYDLGGVFVLPFRGIFPSPTAGEFYFDSAAILGIAMYYLLVFLVVKALELFSKNPNQELA
jgi:hypothetical protein